MNYLVCLYMVSSGSKIIGYIFKADGIGVKYRQ